MLSQRDRIMLGEAAELVRLEVQNGPTALEALAAAAEYDDEADGSAAEESAAGMEPGETREVLIIPDSARGMYGPSYEQWVRDNRSVVDEVGQGRIAYQHIEGMDFRSLARFRRELYSMNREKDALIIDVRFNGGGDIYAQLYEILTSPMLFRSKTRFEQLRATPEWHWQGPIVVLINAWSYSDAEDFAHMMQEQQLATIVGEDTGGNVIAVSGVALLDGSFFGLPLEGWYRLDGRNMEGFGCPADIFVEIDPNALAAGRDNQLEAAITELQRQLGDG
jgi:tricorn protease